MALTRSNNVLDVAIEASRTFLQHKRDQFLAAHARRKLFRTTYNELAALSDRELRDLGIPRASIRRLAMEAVNDC